jgi:hypothetical protein
VAERGFDAEDRLHKTAQQLQLLVSDLYPELDALAWKLVVEALRYVDAAESLLQRVLADGGVSLNFDQLDPEEYLTAAREASVDQLATVAVEVVFDPAAPWADAGTVIETFEQYRPRRPRRERPPDPPVSPDGDPVERIQRAAAEGTKRRLLRADGLLGGSQSTDLTDVLRAAAWPGAGRILADLFMLDSSADHPYWVDFSDALHVDAEAPLTYMSPATLALKPAGGSAPAENDLRVVTQEQAG